jgi:hypothetical protein
LLTGRCGLALEALRDYVSLEAALALLYSIIKAGVLACVPLFPCERFSR